MNSSVFAHVIPLRRVPRRFSLLSYYIPEEFGDRVEAGSIVAIPFQASTILGLVFEVKKTLIAPLKPKTVKPLADVLHNTPLLEESHCLFLKTMTSWYGAPLSTLARMMLPPLQKKKLRTESVIRRQPREGKREKEYSRMISCYHTEAEHAAFFKKYVKGNTLIIVPERFLIPEVAHLLSGEKRATIMWHSGLSEKQQFATWFQVRNARENTVIIGTRGAIFLPFHALDTIIIDYEHDAQHKQWDQTPKYHVKDVAPLLASLYGATLHFLSFSPSSESYFLVHKRQWKGKIAFPAASPLPILTNLSHERRIKNYSPISSPVMDALERHASGDIFLYLNRLGFARAVSCRDCGKRETCATCGFPFVYHAETKTLQCHYCHKKHTISSVCRFCGSTLLAYQGMGTEQVETYIRTLPVAKKMKVRRIDSETEEKPLEEEKNYLIIGTSKAFPSIRWQKTQMIVSIDIDQELNIPEYTAEERVWHSVAEIQFRRPKESMFFIQTYHPEHVILRSVAEPDRWYRTDLSYRLLFGYPPYRYLCRYIIGRETKFLAQKEAVCMHDLIEKRLTEAKKDIMLSAPIEMHPSYAKGKFWYALLLRFHPDSWGEYLPWINTFIPDGWKIDPNPISLLSVL